MNINNLNKTFTFNYNIDFEPVNNNVNNYNSQCASNQFNIIDNTNRNIQPELNSKNEQLNNGNTFEDEPNPNPENEF